MNRLGSNVSEFVLHLVVFVGMCVTDGDMRFPMINYDFFFLLYTVEFELKKGMLILLFVCLSVQN